MKFRHRLKPNATNLSEDAFAGGDALLARVDGDGSAEGAGSGFEAGFGDVVAVASIVLDDMEVNEGVGGEGLPEIIDELRIELADFFSGEFEIADVPGAAAEIDGDGDEGLFHGEGETAVTDDALFIAPSFDECLAESDADIFDGVVLIDLKISVCLDCEVNEAVTGEEGEHVIEEADACVDLRGPGAVQIEAEFNRGFGGLSADGGGARHRVTQVLVLVIDLTIITPERVRAKLWGRGIDRGR